MRCRILVLQFYIHLAIFLSDNNKKFSASFSNSALPGVKSFSTAGEWVEIFRYLE